MGRQTTGPLKGYTKRKKVVFFTWITWYILALVYGLYLAQEKSHCKHTGRV